jgi:hypothetical protein
VPTSRAREKAAGDYRAAELVEIKSPYEEDPGATLSAQFASFATTIQTRLDNDGSGSPISLNGSLEAQVERALSQALRQAGPSGAYGAPGSAATALAPRPSGTSAIGNGSSPGLSTAQAVLVAEASAVRSDMLAALDALQPLSAIADPADVAAYRNIVRAEVLALTTEFARPFLPRPIRVRVLFGALLGWGYAPGYPPDVAKSLPPHIPTGDIAALVFLLNLGSAVVPSALTEDQLALQGVLTADAARLFDLWFAYQYRPPPLGPLPDPPPAMWPSPVDYPRKPGIGGLAALTPSTAPKGAVAQLFGSADVASLKVGVFTADKKPTVPPPPPPPPFSFSERMIRADLLLPVLSRDADQVVGALDAIGFGPGPQETTPIPDLQSDTDGDLGFPELPIQMAQQQSSIFGPTVKDVLDWAADLAGGAGYDLLRQAGQLGLDLLADQADELFWIVAAMITDSTLYELADAQVRIELRSLARDLSALADLSN